MSSEKSNAITIKQSNHGAEVTYRAATLDDIPAMTAVLEAAHLPARLLEPFIETFLVAESAGAVVACGGIEVHGDTAVLRSVAVDEALRGAGVGRVLSEHLVELASACRASDIYLFTADAWPFWQKRGFTEITLDDWREPARASWQYVYVSAERQWAESIGLRTMWMPVPR